MQTIIHSTTIVTADDACAVQYNAAIAIDGDRIAAIGPNAELRYPANGISGALRFPQRVLQWTQM